jgi:iron(III) transport system substrate-binding protein
MKWIHIGIVTVTLTIVASCQTNDAVVNLYTDRHYDVDQTLFDQFEVQSGIRVNVVKLDADPLLTRLETEGDATQADLIFLADAGRLGRAKNRELLKPFPLTLGSGLIPLHLQDADRHWVGLTKRARILVYHPDRVSSQDLSTYEDLAQPKWAGKIAVRSAGHVYNQTWVASMISQLGEPATATWLSGLVSNFAVRDPLTGSKHPIGNDRDQAKAVYSGVADVAIMNSYYLGRMLNSEDPNEVTVAQAVRVFFPNQSTFGTHVNVSGVGLTKHGKRSQNALALVEYLLTIEAQRVFADANFEYPIRTDLTPHALLQDWGSFVEQTTALSVYASQTERAYQLMEASGWR